VFTAAKAQFAHVDGDHLTMLTAYDAYLENGESKDWCWNNFISYRSIAAVKNVRGQLSRAMHKLNLPLVSTDFSSADYYPNIRRCLAAGLFTQVAHLHRDGRYRTVKDNQIVSIHPSSVLDTRQKPKWVLFQDFVLTTSNYVRTLSVVRVEWLIALSPEYFHVETWPQGETRTALEDAYRRAQQEREYHANKASKGQHHQREQAVD
jgi:pre-mRNA-splicing factor ATP-dependent RNA helicase DHX15/PRP43